MEENGEIELPVSATGKLLFKYRLDE
jgi:hypothetical protein